MIRFTRRAGRAEVERLLEYDVQDARAGIALSSDCAACCMGDHDDLLVDVVDLRHPGRRVLLKHKLDAVSCPELTFLVISYLKYTSGHPVGGGAPS